MTSGVLGWTLPRHLVHKRDLVRELVVRDMKLRYKRSYLGIAWTLVNPLLQLLVYDFVFRVLFRVQTPNYTAYLFIGITCWGWFSGAILESTQAILKNKDLIRQPGFPAELLPNVTVGTHLVHYLLTLPVLFGLLWFSGVAVTAAILWLPVVIVVQYLMTLAFAMLAAVLHVKFRDTQYLLGVFLMLGFFVTPILYDVAMVPERYRVFYEFNPMMYIVAAYRSVVLHGVMPDLRHLGVMVAVSLVLLKLFYSLFRRVGTSFVEEL